jgi:glycosyltransferase involved in cell wall biosynthesis
MVIAISEQVKDHLISDFKLREDKIRVVNNGIDVKKFSPQALKDISRPGAGFGLKSGPVIGIVARLSDVKGHIYLIRAMEIILKTFPHAQLLIVGEGKMERELRALTDELKIKESVLFIPETKDTREILASMDVFVMPSLKEGLGLALMEAMSSGLAVVGTDVGGIRSLIFDGQTGILVQPQDSMGLASAITALLQDPHRRETLGRNARDFIAANFSQEKMADETERVYRECVA